MLYKRYSRLVRLASQDQSGRLITAVRTRIKREVSIVPRCDRCTRGVVPKVRLTRAANSKSSDLNFPIIIFVDLHQFGSVAAALLNLHKVTRVNREVTSRIFRFSELLCCVLMAFFPRTLIQPFAFVVTE